LLEHSKEDVISRAIKSARYALDHYINPVNCSRVWCFTDSGRKWLAEAFLEAASEKGLIPYLVVLTGEKYGPKDLQPLSQLVQGLTNTDLILSVFSGGIEKDLPYFKVFPNLRSPDRFLGISAVIRQRYPEETLLTHLLTSLESIETILEKTLLLNNARQVRVKGTGGTNLVCQLMKGVVLPFKIGGRNRHAFLPPSEVTFGVVPGSAQGEIVVDVTVGEFVAEGKLLDPLGLVDQPVHLQVKDGYVEKISGGETARRLSKCFARLEKNSRLLVELGFGLSQGVPTGLIGPDECLQGTFHFGIGDDSFYGKTNKAPVHLDVVCKDPLVDILERKSGLS